MTLAGYTPRTSFNIGISPAPEYTGLTGILPSNIIRTGINLLLGGAAIFSFIYLLWGGWQWITSGGDKEAVEKARKRITHALIGLTVAFSTYGILFVVQSFFGVCIVRLPLQRIGTAISSTCAESGAPTGVSACTCGGSGGCASIGQQGPLTISDPVNLTGPCYTCTTSGWSATGGICGAITCGTCP